MEIIFVFLFPMLIVALLSCITFYYLQNFFNNHKSKTPCTNKYLIVYAGCLLLSTISNFKALFLEGFDLIYLFYAILYLLGFIMIVSFNKHTVKYVLFLVSFSAFWFILSFMSNIDYESYVELCCYAIEGGLIATVFWIVPNYIYFIKRKKLFEKEKVQFSELSNNTKVNNSNTLVIIGTVCSAMSSFLFVVTNISASIFYVYTIYVLFVDYGFWQGFVGLCLPGISSIYLCIAYWIDYGFYNNVTNLGAIIVLLFLVSSVLALISEAIASKHDG